MNALFIGRFQPFHKGHLFVVRTILESYDHVIIGVGSSQYDHTNDNPFSFKERKTMIDKTLAAENIDSFTVVGIPDIHDPPHWVDHVVSLVPGFSAVFTNNAFTASLFDEKGYEVIKPGFHKKETYSGDHIRSAMRQKQSWMNLVHPAIQEYLTKIDAESRIQHIQE